MEHIVIDPMYQLDQLPFKTHCRIVNIYKLDMKPFQPTTMAADLKSGKLNRLVYWYPKLIFTLYSLAYNGKDWRDYLMKHSVENIILFEDIFRETVNKLDKVAKTSENHLGETQIKNSKIKTKHLENKK